MEIQNQNPGEVVMNSLLAERWTQIEALLDHALDLAPDDHAAYLDEACRDQPALRREVEALLAAEQRAPTFLEGQTLDFAHTLLPDALAAWDDASSAEGRRIGPYRLRDEVGRGGMGVVYRAERAEGPFDQEVAVKLLA